MSVLADGIKATIDRSVRQSFAGNLIVENSQSGNEQGIPPGRRRRGSLGAGRVGQVTPVAFSIGRPHGDSRNEAVTAIEPSSFANVYNWNGRSARADAARSLG